MGNVLRNKTIEELAAKLSVPRLQISAILALTASSAFLSSLILLRVGVTDMSLRYPVAVVIGYIVFLILLRVWIWLQREDRSSDINIDLPDGISLPNIGSGGSSSDTFSMGGGGDFAGAGAGGDWADGDLPVPVPSTFVAKPMPVSINSSLSLSSGSSGSSWSFDIGDIDDGVALLVVLVVLVLVFSALIYVVWVAPILFAELIIDAAVVGGLYRPIKNIERRYWLLTALKKTGIPALIVLILMFIAGVVMQSAVPEAITIGQFFEAVLY